MPSRIATPLLNESHLVNFPQRGDPGADFRQSAFAQGNHSFRNGSPLDFGGRAAVHNHFTDMVTQVKKFADGGTTVETRTGALQASGPLRKLAIRGNLGIDAGFRQFRVAVFLRALALRADEPNETLGKNTVESR